MKKILVATILLLWASIASAQFNGCQLGFCPGGIFGGGSGSSLTAPMSFVIPTLGNVNNIKNSSGIGAIAGTPGTLPEYATSDFSDNTKGITVTANGPSTDAGVRGFSYTISGTYAGGGRGNVQIVFDRFAENGSIARISSAYMKITATSGSGYAINTFVNTEDTAGNYLNTLSLASRAVTGTGADFPFTYTTDAATGFVDNITQVTYTAATPFSLTIFYGKLQDERGSTLHNLINPGAIQISAADPFYAQPIPESYFQSGLEAPGNAALLFPYTNGPATKWSRGKSFNQETRWNDTTNPSNGVYNFTTIDAWFASLQSNGITPILTLFTGDSKPSWVGGTAINPTTASWQAWVTALVNRYKGQVRIWEGINEPDGPFWGGGKANAVAYQQFIYTTVKAADPTALVLGPPPTGSTNGAGYLRDLIVLGINPYVDVYPIHNYNFSLSYDPEFDDANAINYQFIIAKTLSSLAQAMKPVMDDESSYALNTNVPLLANKAIFLTKKRLLAWSAGLAQQGWYDLDNPTFGTMVDATKLYNDVATADKIIRNWAKGAVVSPRTVTGSVSTISLTRSGGYTATIRWDASAAATYTIPGSGVTQFRDISGNMYTVSPGTVIPIGLSPLLFESNNTLGQFITGYILSPAQNDKTVWDTARDGALPGGGGYSSTPIAYNTPYSPYQPESLAVFAAFTTPPSTPDKLIIDTDIACLKSNGVWGKLTSYQIYVAQDSQAARVDWANVSRSASLVGTAAFVGAYQGFAMTNITNYVDTGVNPTTAVGSNGTTAAMTQNLNSGGYWELTNAAMGSTYGILSGNGWTIAPGGSGTNPIAYRNWNASAITAVANMADSRGFTAMNRSSNSAAQVYKNGAAQTMNTAAGAAAPTSSNIRVGGTTYTGLITAAMHFSGTSMSTTDHGNLYTCTRTLMTSWGIP